MKTPRFHVFFWTSQIKWPWIGGIHYFQKHPCKGVVIVLEPVAKHFVSGNIPVGPRMGLWIMDVVSMRPEYMGKNGFMTNHHRERMGVVALANPGLISVGWRLTLQYQRWGRWWLVATGQSFHACWPKFYGFCVNSDCFTSYTNFPALNWSHDHCCWDYNCSKSLQTLILAEKNISTLPENQSCNISSPSFIIFSYFFLFFPMFSLQPPALPLLLWSDHQSQDPGGFPGVCGLSGHRWGGSCSGFGRRHGLGLGMSPFLFAYPLVMSK